ncbi:MAG: hypothetical protein AB7O24_20820 [Kofleriaceae bacterium]
MKATSMALWAVLAGALAGCASNGDIGPGGDPQGDQDPGKGDDGNDPGDGDDPTDPTDTDPVPSYDQNGVIYLDLPGYEYVSDRFDWTENFKSNGSMRHDFENAPDGNQCLVGYFYVDGDSDEEISAKLASGPHSDDDPDYADTYDLGLVNFSGDRARLRYESTHPSYDNGPTASFDVGDIRQKWVGAMGCKLNFDSDGDGEADSAKVLAFVDTTGLDGDGKPQNNWEATLDETISFDDVELKSPAEPYVAKIGKPELSQATMRIDGQGDDYDYKFIAYRKLQPKP